MLDHQPLPELHLEPAPPQPEHPQPAHLDADLAQDLATLRELAEIGTDALRHLHAEIVAKPTPPEHREATAAAVERLTRAVRRTIHLRQHLRQTAIGAAIAARTAARDTDATRTTARLEIIRGVENAIAKRTRYEPDALDPEALRAELAERIDTLEFERELRTRDRKAIIADIIDDLGVAGAAKPRRTLDALRDLYARAATPPPDHPIPDHPIPDRLTPDHRSPIPPILDEPEEIRPGSLLEHLLRRP